MGGHPCKGEAGRSFVDFEYGMDAFKDAVDTRSDYLLSYKGFMDIDN